MLLPRYSTRVVLIVTALCAVYFLIVGLGVRGSLWAKGVAVATTSLLFIALMHAALFGLCYVFGQAFMRKTATAPAYPFSDASRNADASATWLDHPSTSRGQHATNKEAQDEEIPT